jgi:hypothetical protein
MLPVEAVVTTLEHQAHLWGAIGDHGASESTHTSLALDGRSGQGREQKSRPIIPSTWIGRLGMLEL